MPTYTDVAEALNNISEGTHYQVTSWDGSQTYDIFRDKEQMRRGVKPVRMRAGVPDYSDEVYENPKKFFEKIVHERQIEFFAETNATMTCVVGKLSKNMKENKSTVAIH